VSERPGSVSDVIRAMRRGKGRPRPELAEQADHLPANLRGLPSPTLNRPVLIGAAPGPRTHPDLALFPAPPTSAGGRLFSWTGLTVEQYMRAFDVPDDHPWMEWREMPTWRIRYACIPHPSGRNHWYNEAGNIKAVSEFLQAWIAVAFSSRGEDDQPA